MQLVPVQMLKMTMPNPSAMIIPIRHVETPNQLLQGNL